MNFYLKENAHVHVNVIVADVNADFTGVPFD